MRNPIFVSARRRLTLAVTVVLLFSALVAVTGIAPATATGEVVEFELNRSDADEGSPPVINVKLTADTAPLTPVVVTISANAGTASAIDYTLVETTVTFPAGSPSPSVRPVALTFNPDVIFETSETLTLSLISTTVGVIGETKTHTVTINDDDTAPTLSIADADPTDEGAGSMIFTVTRTGETEVAATAEAVPSSGTATIGIDFGSTSSAISIPPGGATRTDTFSVTLVNDDIRETDETLNVALSDFQYSSAGDTEAVGTIVDDDPLPTLSIDDVTDDESRGTATFTVTRTGSTVFDTTVDIATSGISATEGVDYTGQARTITILPGGTSRTQTLTVPIIDDAIDEGDETYQVAMSNPAEATLLKATGTGTITDDDTAGIVVDLLDGIFLIEGSDTDTFDLVLRSEPTAPVVVTLTAMAEQVIVTPSAVTFDSTNWSETRQVDVEAVEDGVDAIDPHTSSISFSVASPDPNYNGLPLSDVTTTIGDAGSILVTIDGPSVGAPELVSTFRAVVNAGGTGTITYDWSVLELGEPIANGDMATFPFTPTAGGAYIVRAIVGDDQVQNPATLLEFKVLGDIGTSVFVGDVVWLAEEGITKGCNPPANDEFCPTDFVTRAQMAAFLVRFLGLTDDGGGNTFIDDDGSIFEADIAKLATAGITKGCNPPDNTEFCPTDPVTREQMAAFLVRALTLTDNGGGNTFTDDHGSVFEDDIAKLAAAAITKGCNPPDNTEFCPNDFVTRGQLAAFIRRADAILNP